MGTAYEPECDEPFIPLVHDDYCVCSECMEWAEAQRDRIIDNALGEIDD